MLQTLNLNWMNMICIDLGNTRIKWAEFKGGKMKHHGVDHYESGALTSLVEELNIPVAGKPVWICDVVDQVTRESLWEALRVKGAAEINRVKSMSVMAGVTSGYAEPSLLGSDRWVNMLAAYHDSRRQGEDAVCVVSCGTATTIDVLDKEGQHLGGQIMPGYQMMLSSLNSGTAKLPEITAMSRERHGLLARTTEDAIRWGVESMLLGGLGDVLRREMAELDEPMRVFVAGGDGEWLAPLLASALTDCKIVYDAFITLRGIRLYAEHAVL